MSIDKKYQITHDIDWFAVINEKPCHFASNGGEIPKEIHISLRKIQTQVEFLPLEKKYRIGDAKWIEKVLQEDYTYLQDELYKTATSPRMMYMRSFIQMAQKGFYSYDRDAETDTYHLVAYPTEDIKLEGFELKEIKTIKINDTTLRLAID